METRTPILEVQRALAETEARQQKDGSWTIGGYASTFNDPYEVHDRFGTFSETILPGAWDRTLNERGHKIKILESHAGTPLGSTAAGNLRLSTDDRGLEFEWMPNPRRSRSVDLAEGIADGSITEMSVGMRIPERGDSWNDDMTDRRISEASLLEISIVDRGANGNTTVSAREQELLAEIRSLRALIEPLEDLRVDEPVTLDTDLDGLRRMLAEAEPRAPIAKELALLLELRK